MSPYKLVNISKQHHEQNANHLSTIAVTSTRNKQNKNRQSMQVKGTYRLCFERRNAINDVTKEHIAVCCSSTLLNRCVCCENTTIIVFAAKSTNDREKVY